MQQSQHKGLEHRVDNDMDLAGRTMGLADRAMSLVGRAMGLTSRARLRPLTLFFFIIVLTLTIASCGGNGEEVPWCLTRRRLSR